MLAIFHILHVHIKWRYEILHWQYTSEDLYFCHIKLIWAQLFVPRFVYQIAQCITAYQLWIVFLNGYQKNWITPPPKKKKQSRNMEWLKLVILYESWNKNYMGILKHGYARDFFSFNPLISKCPYYKTIYFWIYHCFPNTIDGYGSITTCLNFSCLVLALQFCATVAAV